MLQPDTIVWGTVHISRGEFIVNDRRTLKNLAMKYVFLDKNPMSIPKLSFISNLSFPLFSQYLTSFTCNRLSEGVIGSSKLNYVIQAREYIR